MGVASSRAAELDSEPTAESMGSITNNEKWEIDLTIPFGVVSGLRPLADGAQGR